MSISHAKWQIFNPLSANPTKWSNTRKQFIENLPTNCFGVFGHFVILVLKGLKSIETVAERCSVKEVFLEISQNSPENICARASILIKLQA